MLFLKFFGLGSYSKVSSFIVLEELSFRQSWHRKSLSDRANVHSTTQVENSFSTRERSLEFERLDDHFVFGITFPREIMPENFNDDFRVKDAIGSYTRRELRFPIAVVNLREIATVAIIGEL